MEASSAGGDAGNSGGDVFVFPLSYAQERMWFIYKLDPGLYTMQLISLRLRGPLVISALERALNELIRRHEILRTSFPEVDGRPVQRVVPSLEVSIALQDIAGVPEPERPAEAARRIEQASRTVFELTQLPLLLPALLRLAEDDHIFAVFTHHILADGWSLGIFHRELEALYATFCRGEPPALPELPIQYADYVIWERECLERGVFNGQLDYWREHLAGGSAVLRLPSDREPPAMPSYAGAKRSFELSPGGADAVRAFCRDQGVTLYTLMLAAFKVLLHRYTGRTDLTVGTVTANRNRVELEHLIGFFVNTVVLRTDASHDPPFTEFLRRVRDATLGAFANQELPYDCVVDALQPVRALGQNPFFQIAFSRLASPLVGPRFHDLDSAELRVEGDFTRFDLELHVFDAPGTVQGLCVYSTALFDEATIDRMLGHYQELVKSAVARPDLRLSELTMLTREERARLLPERQRAEPASQREVLVHRLFEAQVDRAPQGVVIQDAAGPLTWKELDERANQLAHHLLRLGISPGTPVGVALDRSIDLALACLAVLKAGCAVMPLNPADPPEYRARQLEGQRLSALVTTGPVPELLPSAVARVHLERDRDAIAGQASTRPAAELGSSSPAWFNRTTARGFVISHRALSARLLELQRRFQLSSTDALAWCAPWAHDDAACWELLWPLACGARAVVMRDSTSLGDIVELGITVLGSTAPELGRIVGAAAAKPDLAHKAALRRVICRGEPLATGLVRQALAALPGALHFLYGSPEAGAALEVHTFAPGERGELVSLGAPGARAMLVVLDEKQRLLPLGLPGRIWAGGEGIARAQGADRFEREPRFCDVPSEGGPAMPMAETSYRGCWTAAGELELRGGAGLSGWIGGVRLDCAEIEAVLLEQPDVRACKVLVRAQPARQCRVVAHLVAPEQDAARLSSALRTRLPAHMVPESYVFLTSLPLSPDGQIDVAALTRLPVADDQLAEQWEERLRAVAEIREVAVLVRSADGEPAPLHVSELLLQEEAGAACAEPRTRAQAETPGAQRAPSIVRCAPLPESPSLCGLGSLLERAAREAGDKGIRYVEANGAEVWQPYSALYEQALRISGALKQAGTRPKDPILLQIDQNPELLPTFWGCVLAGLTPVPVAVPLRYEPSNAAAAKLVNAWKLLERPLIVASDALVDQVRAFGAELGLEDCQVTALSLLTSHAPDPRPHTPAEDDLALLLLTSGSTGLPKAVIQTHRMIVRRSMSAVHQLGLTRDDISLNWMPLDHVGGLVMSHVRDVFSACDQVHAHIEPVLQDPLRWLDWIDRFRCTTTWAPNFAFALINERAEQIVKRTWNLSCMRVILNGGESIVPRTGRQFLRLLMPYGLPASAIHPGWGMTETTSGIVHSSSFSLETTRDEDAFVDIGPPCPGTALRVVDAGNAVVEEGVIGHLQVQGETVTPGYFGRPELNREIFTEDGWFSTGDLALLKNGRMTITGRAKDEIIVNGLNYFPHEIESVVERVVGVEASSAAACGVRVSDGETDVLVIFFSPVHGDDQRLGELLQSIRRTVVTDIGLNPKLVIPIPRDTLPRTAIGKIRRAELKSRFVAGEFQPILRRVEVLLGTSNALPSWFHERTWRRKEPALCAASLAAGPHATALFLDRGGLGAAAADHLRSAGRTCVTIAQSDAFSRLDRTSYTIRPGHPTDYQQLTACLADDGVRLEHVLHLFTHDHDPAGVTTIEALRQAQAVGVMSLLFLVQALHRAGGPGLSLQLDVISKAAQPADGQKPLAIESATLLGLLRTIALEMPWIRCRHLDLEASGEASLHDLLGELRAVDREMEVAFRGGQRLVPRLVRLDLRTMPPSQLPFRRDAFFLVTGGLGGIGTHVCKALLTQYGVRLLIVGKTALPPREQWAELSDRTVVARRVRSYRELEACGEILYAAAPVEDLAALERAVAQAQEKWSCPLSGVLHMAGEGSLESHLKSMEEHRITNASAESFERMFAPKVFGTWSLLKLLEGHPDAALIAFSSVNAVFGAPTLGAYSAANSFVDHGVLREHRAGRSAWCIDFAMWNDIGMSEGGAAFEPIASEAMGYHLISPREGLDSLLAVLARRKPQVVVGLRGGGRIARSGSLAIAAPCHEIAAFIVPEEGAPANGSPEEIRLKDRFGTPSPCAFIPVERLQRTPDGSIDRAALQDLRSRRGGAEGAYLAPQTDIERGLATIWQEVLGATRAGIDDNFFDLGGNSLLTVRVKSLVESAFHVELSIVDLFKHPTIRSLAAHIGEPKRALLLDEGHERAAVRRKAFEHRLRIKRGP